MYATLLTVKINNLAGDRADSLTTDLNKIIVATLVGDRVDNIAATPSSLPIYHLPTSVLPPANDNDITGPAPLGSFAHYIG